MTGIWRLWLIAVYGESVTSEVVGFQTRELANDAFDAIATIEHIGVRISVVKLYNPAGD